MIWKHKWHICVLVQIVGEWWKADTETVINQAMQTGGAPNVSDAFTINGLPGPLYNCSAKGIYISYPCMLDIFLDLVLKLLILINILQLVRPFKANV